MEQKLIDEINTLAKKQREGGLTEDEKARQFELRQMYIKEVRESLRVQLENIEIVDDKNEEK